MKRDFNPVDVELSIENPSIERGAFYRLCFITESNIAPRTLKVTRLQDLLDNGYSRLDLAYNFCVGVFSQQGIDTVYIRAKRSYESYVEAYNSDDNSMYYFVVLQTKDLTEIKKFNSHLVSSDEMKLQFFSQNVGSKTLQSPKLVNYYQDYTRPEGGVSSVDRDFYLNSAYEGLVSQIKLSLPDYLLSGLGNIAIEYGIYNMTGKKQIWEIDKAGRRIRYAPEVLQQGWVGSKEESTVSGSDITVVAYKGSEGVSKKSTVLNPKVKIETLSRELLKGLGKEVLDYAIPLIDPKAKDWVLDPANNAVKYKPKAVTGSLVWSAYAGGNFENGTFIYPTAEAAGRERCSIYGYDFNRIDMKSSDYAYVYCDKGGGAVDFWDVSGVPNPAHDPSTGADGYKSIPIVTVAQQVIDNADAGHLESQVFLKSIPLFAYLLTGSGTEAVNKAVLDIDPEAAGWVLDPDSNQITIGVDSGMLSITAPRYKVTGSTPNEVCEDFVSTHNSLNTSTAFWGEYRFVGSTPESCILRFNGLRGLPENEWGDAIRDFDSPASKKIPIDTVAAQVIANAEAGHTPSQEALRLATVERVATGEYDEALEAASTEIDTSWKYLPIYDVAVQVKRNSIAGHAESIEAVNNSLPFELPDNDTPWSYVPEQTSVIGSTTTVKAKRTFKNQKLKSTISVTASASKVGESLIKGGGSDALAYAAPQLIGEGIDWVLDPENNRIKYTVEASGDYDSPSKAQYYKAYMAGRESFNSTAYLAALDACKIYNGSTDVNMYGNSYECSDGGNGSVHLVNNPNYDPSAPTHEDRYLPINTVAAKVISNAEAGHAPSQEAVKATALEGFAAGEHDAALDAAATKDN